MNSPTTVQGVLLDGSSVEMSIEHMHWRPSVYALIFDELGRLLVLDNPLTSKKELPGGGIEIWETIEEAIVREIWEETGLSIRPSELIHIEDSFFLTPSGKHWHTLKFFFQVKILSGTLRNTIIADEWGTNPHWVDSTSLDLSQFQHGQAAIHKALSKL